MNVRKKRPYLLLIFALPVIGFAGCKKHSAHPATVCKVAAITSTALNNPVHITYTPDHRFQSIQSGTPQSIFTYNATTKVESMSFNAENYFIAASQLNGRGQIMQTTVYYHLLFAPGTWLKATYQYSGNEVTQINTVDDKGKTDVINFTWHGGNIISMTDHGETVTYTYYTDKPNRAGDYFYYVAITDQFQKAIAIFSLVNPVFLKNKNLVKSSSNPHTPYSITYQFGGADKITAMTISPSAGAATIVHYDYDCK